MTESLNRRHAELQEKLFHIRNDYLELVQSCLTGSIYRDANQAPFGPRSFDPDRRAHGLDWPSRAQTMVGEKRLANLRALTESVIADDVPGDLIETGVWRGGACILMRAVLFAHSITGRTVWVADSFEGLPQASEQQYPADAGSDFHTYEQLAVSIDEVKDNFQAYGFLDERTKFLKGWFKDTLPVAPISQLALLRLDGDMYESTIDALTYLYPKLSHQGYVIIDDYHVVPACKAAVRDYCNKNDINPDIIDIDGVGVFWRKADVAGQSRVPAGPRPSVAPPEMQISRLSEAVLQLNQYVAIQLNRSLAERDEEVARLDRSLAERYEEVARLSQSLNERDEEVAGLNRSLAERDEEVARLNRSLAERDEEVARLNRSLAERNEEVAGLGQSLSKRDAEIGRLQVELKTVYSSASWRITKPFRIIKKFARSMRSDHPFVERSAAEELSPKLNWVDDTHLIINDVCFHLSYDTEKLLADQSSENDFLLGKPRHMIERAVAIGQQQRVTKMFEMGILKGGSIVLYDQIYQLKKIAAIDHAPEPVAALTRYISTRNRSDVIKPYYGISQADRSSMENILSLEFPHKDIDLIVDDASHLYEETREAFNISFPYLKEGGLYIIEDWAWAHWAGDYWQREKNPSLAGKTALSNLPIELFMLAASRPDLIKDMYLDHNLIIIKRGNGALPKDKFNIADHYLLRGRQFRAWL